MGEKKHIDRLFQEKFKDFEAHPRDEVWSTIESRLHKKKKKRRAIPLWWRYAGVAALLVLLLGIGNLIFNSGSTIKAPSYQVGDTNSSNDDQTTGNTGDSDSKKDQNIEVIVNSADEIAIDEVKELKNNNEASDNIAPFKNTNPITEENLDSKKNITSNKEAVKPSDLNTVLKDDNTLISKDNNIAAQKELETKGDDKTDAMDRIQKEAANYKTFKSDSSVVVKTNPKDDATEDKNDISIEDLIDKDINELIEEEKFSRWSVAPNAAPVYFNSLGTGSSIDPQFNNNAKTGELNMSYGIKASYAINKKIRIRSGINKVRLGYNTNDVVIYQSIGFSENAVGASLSNIKSNSNNSVSSLSSVRSSSFASAENINLKSNAGLLSSVTNTTINQEFGYIEIPLEIQYTILDKKFGLNLIGGFSSFFLSENKVYSESTDSRTLLGEANNLNNVSYSANLGLGLNYKLSKKLDFNLEPLFKYQINTFSNTSGNFNPYFIGVYTGFAIKF
ncbi:hypothetical protein [Aestuariivivens sediminicola]|uniref:hypothetical protein n=1 Tax=Aestuariivivens sediminicola TaxID=2913560 RepID=UPI001F56C986|nr:hypothetical protein [Aestuariivivens sediminicola]